ncbi:hypothetical protein C8A03DRAFT_29572 [Achaetomium macrosporum]|uniref:Uncharacterized protein n=1 Tax=Achaetomium macrosporum TaxID=79813 RepID=A0AAN7CHS6_9PEZI|nr:hypothetical protein C8A03DRAFT_29572 [Achaetomium macrosporum]
MCDTKKGEHPSISGVSDGAPLRGLPTAAFIGYRPFPQVMNLYANYSSAGVLSAMKSHKLCGATESDFLYLVEYHLGYTPRGPLNFGRGYYLRNGTTFKDPILAATGEEFPIPLLVSLFNPTTIVKLPPLDMAKNPRDMVDEVLRAGASKKHVVIFSFTIEVGVKRMQRESFEWRKAPAAPGEKQEEGGHKVKTRYILHRLAPGYPAPSPSASSTAEQTDSDSDVVAVLACNHFLSFTHLFTLELKGAGLTGELGDRWILMVVTTALSIHLLRQLGKTGKVTVGAAQKIHGN